MTTGFVRQEESSDIQQEYSHKRKCISETSQELLGQGRRKRNEDWYDYGCISMGRETNEARMRLINRNTTQSRELYKQKWKEAYRLYRKKKGKKINKQTEDIQNQSNNKEYRKFYKGVKELRTEYTSKIYKLVDKRERTLVERNEVMEEMSNYFQELAKENGTVFEKKTDERD